MSLASKVKSRPRGVLTVRSARPHIGKGIAQPALNRSAFDRMTSGEKRVFEAYPKEQMQVADPNGRPRRLCPHSLVCRQFSSVETRDI